MGDRPGERQMKAASFVIKMRQAGQVNLLSDVLHRGAQERWQRWRAGRCWAASE